MGTFASTQTSANWLHTRGEICGSIAEWWQILCSVILDKWRTPPRMLLRSTPHSCEHPKDHAVVGLDQLWRCSAAYDRPSNEPAGNAAVHHEAATGTYGKHRNAKTSLRSATIAADLSVRVGILFVFHVCHDLHPRLLRKKLFQVHTLGNIIYILCSGAMRLLEVGRRRWAVGL